MLAVALLFIGALGVLTVLDVVHYGLTAVDVVALGVLLLFLTGTVGALLERPKE